MTAFPRRARIALLSAVGVLLATSSFGVVHSLGAQNSASQTLAADDNPVAGVTIPTTTVTASPTTTTTAAPATTTTAKPAPTTTAVPKVLAVLCQFHAHIVAGGLDSPSGPVDQFVVTVQNSAWAGRSVHIRMGFTDPARPRAVYTLPPRVVTADNTGLATFVIPIGSESQGGSVSVSAASSAPHPVYADATVESDPCGPHLFVIDYNGAEGLAPH